MARIAVRKPAPLGYRGPSIPLPTAVPAALLLVVGIAPAFVFKRSRRIGRHAVD